MNIRKKLEQDSLKRSLLLSPAQKICMALELSQLVFALHQAVDEKKDRHEKSRKRVQKIL